MKITINTDILAKENITLAEYLVLLGGYYDVEYEKTLQSLKDRGIVNRNLFQKYSVVCSDNTKNWIASIIVKSNDAVIQSKIDFEGLAVKLQNLYPEGVKPGTTYEWRGTVPEIAQKLRVLVAEYNFIFTEEEAVNAVKEYVSSSKEDQMMLLKYFILRTYKDSDIYSQFMSIIENSRVK